MSKIRTHLLALALIVGLLSSGCLLRRTIVDVTDHPKNDVLLVKTVDVYPFTVRQQFWNCVDGESDLVCEKVCGGSNKLTCHEVTFGMSNLR